MRIKVQVFWEKQKKINKNKKKVDVAEENSF